MPDSQFKVSACQHRDGDNHTCLKWESNTLPLFRVVSCPKVSVALVVFEPEKQVHCWPQPNHCITVVPLPSDRSDDPDLGAGCAWEPSREGAGAEYESWLQIFPRRRFECSEEWNEYKLGTTLLYESSRLLSGSGEIWLLNSREREREREVYVNDTALIALTNRGMDSKAILVSM